MTLTGGNWLAIWPNSGSTPGSVLLTVSPLALAVGTYTATLSIEAPGTSNSILVVPVSITVTAFPVLTVAPNSLIFDFLTGGSSPTAQTLAVSSSGAPLSFSAATIGASWLSVSGGGTTLGVVTVTANPAGLAAGTYTSSVTVTASGAGGSPFSLPVKLHVTSQATSRTLLGSPSSRRQAAALLGP